jgi:hypothetical protein
MLAREAPRTRRGEEVTELFDEVDAAVAHTDLGLRGKLGGRRIVLDCVTQARLAASAGAECGLRAVAQISGPGQFEPTPAQAIWTRDGPLLNGQKWALAQP